MKIRLIIFGLIFLVSSCQNKEYKHNRTDIKSKDIESFMVVDTLSHIEMIDVSSLKDTIIDVLWYFNDLELPNIYRLGSVTYQPYFIESKLVKIILVFDGDRETLEQAYYFNNQEEVFYINRVYRIYNPPKWEEKSVEVSATKSEYFIVNDRVQKSLGNNIISSDEIIIDLKKIIRLKKTFSDKKSR